MMLGWYARSSRWKSLKRHLACSQIVSLCIIMIEVFDPNPCMRLTTKDDLGKEYLCFPAVSLSLQNHEFKSSEYPIRRSQALLKPRPRKS
ncbi:hypothetical protein BDV06DRAFT_197057 [Aspergillus oleicola]